MQFLPAAASIQQIFLQETIVFKHIGQWKMHIAAWKNVYDWCHGFGLQVFSEYANQIKKERKKNEVVCQLINEPYLD